MKRIVIPGLVLLAALGAPIAASAGATTENPPANVDPNQGAFAFHGMRRLSPNAEVTFGARWDVLQ
jgi:hypothetical protein